jgi:hypothetical protein
MILIILGEEYKYRSSCSFKISEIHLPQFPMAEAVVTMIKIHAGNRQK